MNLTRLVGAGALAALTCVRGGQRGIPDCGVLGWFVCALCVKGYHEAFTEETGIEVRLEDYNGGLAQLRAQVDAGAVHWDVIDMELADAMTGCDEGLLEVLDLELPLGRMANRPRTTSTRKLWANAALARCFIRPSMRTARTIIRERNQRPLPIFSTLRHSQADAGCGAYHS